MKSMIFILLILLVSCAHNSRKYADVDDRELLTAANDLDQSYKKRPEEIKYLPAADLISLDSNPMFVETIAPGNKAEGFINEILILCSENDIDQGLEKADTQYYQYKSHPDYWNAIGICFYKKKQFRKSLLYLQKSLDINSNYAPTINSFGMVYLAQNNQNKAYEAFSAAIKKSPGAIIPRINLAQLLMSYGLYSKAETLLSNINNVPEASQLLGIINYYTKNKEVALKELQVLWEAEKVHGSFGLNYSIVLAKAGNMTDAKKVLKSIQKKLVTKEQYQTVEKIIEGEL